VASGATAVDCTLLADTARVRLGSELHVAPCATDNVVAVIAGKAADDWVEDEVVAALTMLAGGQLEIEGAAVAVEASEIDEIGIELGRE
jgi:hypothetical protein